MENNILDKEELEQKMREFEAQIAKKNDEIHILTKELDKCRMLASTNYNEYVGKFVKIEIMPCTYRYIRVMSVTLNKDDLPVLHGTGFDKTILLIKSTTSFANYDVQCVIMPDTNVQEITEDEYEKIKQKEIEKLSKL